MRSALLECITDDDEKVAREALTLFGGDSEYKSHTLSALAHKNQDVVIEALWALDKHSAEAHPDKIRPFLESSNLEIRVRAQQLLGENQ